MRICICGGCSNSNLLSDHLRFHGFPDRRKNGAGFRAWVHFVQVKRKDFFFTSVTKYTYICAAHFRPEDYVSGDMMEFKMGFRSEKRVRLKAGVVPSIHAAAAAASGSATGGSEDHGPVRDSTIRKRKLCTSRPDAVTGHHTIQARFHDAGCQTDPPHTVSVGTQTWVSPHGVSDGTQPYREATVACPRVGPETMSGFRDLPLSPSPIGAPVFSPSNRLCMEMEVEVPITEFKVEPLDSSSNPGNSVVKEEPDSLATHDNAKYIVFEGCLRELFDSCPVCRGQCEVQRRRRGTYVAFSQHCRHCRYSRGWQSQPIVGSTPLGNLQLSAATYLTGASFFKLARIFKAMQLQTFNQDTFRRHTQCFLEPAVVHKWKKEQQILFQKLHQQGKVTVCGGMRADSPGHSTKISTYSLMHMESNTIIDVQLVKSNEVGGNDHMEMEGMKQSLDLLEQNGVEVDYMVTERQPQILNHLMERKIPQLHDVWVLEKVDKILHNEAVFCDVVQMSQHNQTSFLEAFHSLIQSFAPQKVDLPFMGLLCRLYLAIMHYNENAERKQAGTHPGPAVLKTDPTYNYVDALLKLVFEEVVENPTPFVDELKSIPVPDHA
ncbi:uncharacterized protein LOC130404150 isoform X2 [Gadus chalcogrammus]|uniref:uncharacterized protein LOC130404150 isoform X2 n=1 Tax=Gadus chalcogrammus TaxID=1042646 RepID=UPI0024C48779|nr:uncharacterized protein LOC130404150 isoform X2 [Gadus chalcogrammus]